MKTEDYINMYRNKPLLQKVVAFGESIENMDAASLSCSDARRRENNADAEYWSNEYKAHLDRVNGIFMMIREQIEKEERRNHLNAKRNQREKRRLARGKRKGKGDLGGI